MAIATTQGHVQRAIELYNKAGKYFIIGGTIPWADEASPDSPSVSDFRLIDVVGYKKVDNCHLVIPDENGTISYRTGNWRIVPPPFSTNVTSAGITSGTSVFYVTSTAILNPGDKLRIANTYEGIILEVNSTTNQITLDTPAPVDIIGGSIVEAGAVVEGAKYVYLDCYLEYEKFPIVTYRQVGLCTGVTPDNESVLRAAEYSSTGSNEFTSTGILEIIDNRPPSTRDIDQRELLSLIVEL